MEWAFSLGGSGAFRDEASFPGGGALSGEWVFLWVKILPGKVFSLGVELFLGWVSSLGAELFLGGGCFPLGVELSLGVGLFPGWSSFKGQGLPWVRSGIIFGLLLALGELLLTLPLQGTTYFCAAARSGTGSWTSARPRGAWCRPSRSGCREGPSEEPSPALAIPLQFSVGGKSHWLSARHCPSTAS